MDFLASPVTSVSYGFQSLSQSKVRGLQAACLARFFTKKAGGGEFLGLSWSRTESVTCKTSFAGDSSVVSALQSLQRFSVSDTATARSNLNYRSKYQISRAVAESLLRGSDGISKDDVLIDDQGAGTGKVEYDWESQWYPMYLSRDMPLDSPLGLTIFDQSLVLFYDGHGTLNCFYDRCPHRLAKLSEGQIMNGNLECLYHGWQFEGGGSCTKIPQLAAGAKIPKSACVRTYAVKESQGVIWVWLGDKSTADSGKIPWFEHYASEGFQDVSAVHELPYDYTILLENLMDPAHIPISHDRTDLSAKREDAQALKFEVTERTDQGFSGKWDVASSPTFTNVLRFEAPCVLRNDKTMTKDGKTTMASAVFLCRPSGQGKSMLIVRFGSPAFRAILKWVPEWWIHCTGATVFEQDMGFLSSQNVTLVRENVPTKDLYLSLKSSDTWVTEFRKWLDKTGHGMPYYVGHRTVSPPPNPAILEAAPAGFVAYTASSYPSKGGLGSVYAPNLTNRYWRHAIHCIPCRTALKTAEAYQHRALVAAVLAAALAVLLSTTSWRAAFVIAALLMWAASWVCSQVVHKISQNFLRSHRK